MNMDHKARLIQFEIRFNIVVTSTRRAPTWSYQTCALGPATYHSLHSQSTFCLCSLLACTN